MPFDGFTPFTVPTANGVEIAGIKGGDGPPLLLLHGHPQTHMIWHRCADDLAKHFTVIATDLRGYGASSKPPSDATHAAYSKRAMAADQVAVMRHFGFERFLVCAHDRGARVAHRMALDHADAVERLMLLDIAPTLAMYEQTNREFATLYFHWFLLIQPEPLPEALIGADPDAYIERVMGSRHAGLAPFAPKALGAYRAALRQPGAVHAMCEDYRASATIDLEHDRADIERGHKVACPLRVLWGEHGVIEQCFDPLAEWRKVARDVSGRALACGHYIPEEASAELTAEILSFFEATERQD
ncbi:MULTISPECIES: alpha/beta fold hydrolase [Paraburkholderia]|uniref:Haloacetate dehalogenase n=2 Tax=Paraburkholderia TaxID=1822464 RepID=A0A1A5X8P0_9BURK|nr:alpha/beta hydrolase [Paraburkholderia tropica]MBB2978159.1 haloacetate dehalogenase [Paraburkholderia tropica]MBB2998135.1 haloacetate dehalogenase [Paraburkholderia tropica]MBB6317158.1 haloacetate dehalogenase [Paraburkholderia tropica]MDE1142273.1 alpha/beta hydrolase [Paraburkholderia tropica]OBR49433.1 alpha/beta hydrolase [Paraburkholderia tropica]